jgi:hypothetical protein
MKTMKKPFTLNLQLFAETGVNFEEILTKHAGEDGSIPADAISKAAQAISSAVGRSFVDKKRYNEKLDEIETLKADKQTAEDKLTTAEKWQKKYTDEHDAFEKFKADTDAKNKLSELKSAYKKLLTEAGIDAKRHDAIIRATSFDGMKLGEDGKLENADGLKKDIDKDWADFKVTTTTKGATVDNPPANNGPAKRTKEEIIAIKDRTERQKAIAENHELFGF